ncbi:hypothetical protein evm_011006 [Chilo suppressalis]|nr:hypothetical protein evm_011006 [Chilo suppressalis]
MLILPRRLIECIRARPLAALLAVEAPRARFLAGWAPAVPLQRDAGAGGAGAQAPTKALHASEAFLDCALAVVVATTESYQFFSEDEVRHGFEEEHRNRILRTYVRNVYRYHRNEIFAAIRNEYTDWEKPIQHPINIRDATLESLSDAAVGAPALRVAQLHARRGARTYFAHFAHQSRDADYPQQCFRTDTTQKPSKKERTPSLKAGIAFVRLLVLQVSMGDGDHLPSGEPSAGTKLRVKSHYRGHKMALWLHLIPQIHRPGAAPRHHQFRSIHPDMFAGEIFPELYTTTASFDDEDEPSDPEEEASEVEECEPSPSPRPALSALPAPRPTPKEDSLTNLDSQYYSYTVALGVTVGAGCFLLALNVLVFAGIYLQKGRRRAAHRRPRREGSCNSRTGTGSLTSDPTLALSPRKSTLKRSSELELKERPNNVPPPAKKRVQIQEISV